MQSSPNTVIISQGKKPSWQTALAALLFLMGLLLIYNCYLDIRQSEAQESAWRRSATTIYDISFIVAAAVYLTKVKDVFIDLQGNKVVSKYSVGPFSFSKKNEVPELEYVSVFRNADDLFEVNLWYKGNKYYKMYNFTQPEPAFEVARYTAGRLNLDILDATVRGANKWIDKANG
jgi:hypothetical protein